MSEELKYKLFSPTDCLSEQTMYAYIDHKLTPKEQHAVEKHLLECELCADAMEGLRLVKNRNITAEINREISERMAAPPVAVKKENRFTYRTIISIAAVLLLLIGGVFLFNYFSAHNEKTGMADLKTPVEKQKQAETGTAAPAEQLHIDSESFANARPETQAKINNIPSTGSGVQTFSWTSDSNATAKDEAVAAAEEAPQPDEVVTLSPPVPAGNYEVEHNRSELEQVNKEKLADSQATKAKDVAKANNFKADDLQELQEVVVTTRRKPREEDKKKADQQSIAQTPDKTPGVIAAGENKNASGKFESQADSTRTFGNLAAQPNISATTTNATSTNGYTFNSYSGAAAPAAGSTNNIVVTGTDTDPQYPGGQLALMQFVTKNAHWPAVNDGVNGTLIVVELTIDATGKATNPKILKSINADFDKEVFRLVSIMPNWKPAKKNGKNVSSVYKWPIRVDFK